MRRAESGGCAGGRGRALAVVLATGSAAFLAVRPLAAQTTQEVQAAAETAIRRLDLQTEFPRVPEPPSWHFNLPPETLWIVVAIAIAILAYVFRDTFLSWGPAAGSWTEPEGALGDASASSEAMVLGAADELAARGQFVEAMHVLLLQGLAYIRQRLNRPLSDSLTSREILRSTNLPEAARASLRDVIARVELTYFGRRPAALADYTACRTSFHALMQALYGASLPA
jgi:hypothetical protein